MSRFAILARGALPVGPLILQGSYITAANFNVGVLATAHPPLVFPADATIGSPVWRYADGSPVPGASGTTYTFQVADDGEEIYVVYEVSAYGITVPSESAAVGPILPAASTAPVVANQTLNFGRLTLAVQGGTGPVNTGGAITSASIDAGTNASHWQITASGVITPSAAGVLAGLSSSYSLTMTFGNGFGSVQRTITINTEANAYDVGAGDVITATAQMTNACNAIGNGGGVAKKIYWREGAALTWSTGWLDSRSYSARVTVEARTRRTATATVTTRNTNLTSWNLITLQGVNVYAPFLRNSMVASGGPWLWAGTIGDIEFNDCDLGGNVNLLVPGSNYMGWMAVSGTANRDSANVRFVLCDIHGIQRLLVPTGTTAASVPGPIFLLDRCDLYDMVSDAFFGNNYWQQVTVKGTYIHNPYADEYRVYNFSGPTRTWKRLSAWTGASDGKKFLLMVKVNWQYNIASLGNWVLYSEGEPSAPNIKVWRDTSGKMNALIRDTAGNIVAQIQTANTYNFGLNSAENLLAFSVDTDRDAQLHMWRETDNGGGSWVESLSAATAGQTLKLTGGKASYSGLYDGTESGRSGFNDYMAVRRVAAWHDQGPDLTTDQTSYISNTTAIVCDMSVLTGLYGTPSVLMDNIWSDWGTDGNQGDGGQWDVHSARTFDHIDLAQSAYRSTGSTVNVRYVANVLWSGFDTSAKYARPLDPTGALFGYIEAQGFFGEDISGSYQKAVEDGNLIVANNSYGNEPYNSVGSVLTGNTCVTLPSWNPTDSAGNIPNCRIQIHGTGPLTGSNTVADNAAQGTTSAGSGNDVSNNSTGVAPSNYSTLYVGPGGPEPTTRAELLAYFAPIPGGTLLTAGVLKRGAIDTYYDHDLGTADSPRSNTAAGVSITDLVGQTPGGTSTSAPSQITNIYNSELAASTNGGLVVISGGISAEFRVTSDAGGSSVVTNWTSTATVMAAGNYLWLRATAPASGVTSSILYRVGRTTDTWTVTST